MNIFKRIKSFFSRLFKKKDKSSGEAMGYGILVNNKPISHLFRVTRVINLSSGDHTINYSNDKFIIPVFKSGYVKKYWQNRNVLKIELQGNITLYEVTIR
jgi:hypothetical protein